MVNVVTDSVSLVMMCVCVYVCVTFFVMTIIIPFFFFQSDDDLQPSNLLNIEHIISIVL